MSIFKQTDFTSHSGKILSWKIECDDLTKEDLDTLAFIVSRKFIFNDVIGIPTGGMRFANALTQYIDKKATYPLIVDDVLTTGKSMIAEAKKLSHCSCETYTAIGVVIFSRIENYPDWIHPIFKLSGNF